MSVRNKSKRLLIIGILVLAGVRFEHQWSAQEYLDFLADNGWHVSFSKEMAARIAMMYTECERK